MNTKNQDSAAMKDQSKHSEQMAKGAGTQGQAHKAQESKTQKDSSCRHGQDMKK